MAGSTANPLVNPAVSASGEVDTLLIEKFTGQVKERYLKGENLQSYFDMQSVKGTNMISNKYLGETELQTMIPGQEAEGTEVEYDKNALVVDSSVIARNIVAQFHDVQSDIDDNKGKIARDHAKNMKRLEDAMIIQQMVLGAILNNEDARTNPRVAGHGFSIKLDISDAQSEDPNSVLAAIEYVLEKQLEQENEQDEFVCLIPWRYYNILADANQIVNMDYVTAGDVEIKNGMMLKRWRIPLVPSNRFPKVLADGKHHPLATKQNGFRYDPTAAQANAIAVLFTPDALLIGNTLEMQSDIFWDKKTKAYFIDTWMAEGAIPDRWEAVGAVFKGAGSDNEDIKRRANRKAFVTTTVTA